MPKYLAIYYDGPSQGSLKLHPLNHPAGGAYKEADPEQDPPTLVFYRFIECDWDAIENADPVGSGPLIPSETLDEVRQFITPRGAVLRYEGLVLDGDPLAEEGIDYRELWQCPPEALLS